MRPRLKHLAIQAHASVAVDLLCMAAAIAISVSTRIGPSELREYVYGHFDGWLIFAGLLVFANYISGAYDTRHIFSRFNLAVSWLFSLSFAVVGLAASSYVWLSWLLGRGVLLLTLGWYSVLALVLKSMLYDWMFRSDAFTRRVTILGTGPWARNARSLLESKWVLPIHKVVACLRLTDIECNAPARQLDAAPGGVCVVACTSTELEETVRSLDVDLLVLAASAPYDKMLYHRSVRRLRFEGIEVMTAMSVAEVYAGRTPLELLTEESLSQICITSGLPLARQWKRAFDIVGAAAGSLLFLPVAAAIALSIKLSAWRSPVFYSQVRVGRFGKLFRIYKFRTMRDDAEQSTGAVWAAERDGRVTRIGMLLRRFRLDEIPQFVNVLRGEMSLVGPRPERPEIIADLEKKIPYYSERLNALPGMTGWAQVRYPYGDSLKDAARKLEYDLYYIKYMSFSLDLQIILATIRIVLLGKERKN